MNFLGGQESRTRTSTLEVQDCRGWAQDQPAAPNRRGASAKCSQFSGKTPGREPSQACKYIQRSWIISFAYLAILATVGTTEHPAAGNRRSTSPFYSLPASSYSRLLSFRELRIQNWNLISCSSITPPVLLRYLSDLGKLTSINTPTFANCKQRSCAWLRASSFQRCLEQSWQAHESRVKFPFSRILQYLFDFTLRTLLWLIDSRVTWNFQPPNKTPK